MKRFYFIFCWIVFGFVATSFQLPGYTRVFWPGHYSITLPGSKKLPVTCTIEVVKYSSDMVRNGWWGIGGSYAPEDSPKSVISSITFLIGKKEILSPLSSFADLANPQWAKVQKIAKGYRLVIAGGDGAFSYSVTVDFNNDSVTRRTVTGGQVPGKPSETTQYGPNKPAEF